MLALMHVQVKTTSPKKYCVRPNTGIIPPQSSTEVIGKFRPLCCCSRRPRKHEGEKTHDGSSIPRLRKRLRWWIRFLKRREEHMVVMKASQRRSRDQPERQGQDKFRGRSKTPTIDGVQARNVAETLTLSVARADTWLDLAGTSRRIPLVSAFTSSTLCLLFLMSSHHAGAEGGPARPAMQRQVPCPKRLASGDCQGCRQPGLRKSCIARLGMLQ